MLWRAKHDSQNSLDYTEEVDDDDVAVAEDEEDGLHRRHPFLVIAGR